jgi:hypothetical protein
MVKWTCKFILQLSCQELGGALVEIETATENDYLAAYIRDKQSMFFIYILIEEKKMNLTNSIVFFETLIE